MMHCRYSLQQASVLQVSWQLQVVLVQLWKVWEETALLFVEWTA